MEMVLEKEFAAYTNLPEGSTAGIWDPAPDGNGEPGTGVSAPLAASML